MHKHHFFDRALNTRALLKCLISSLKYIHTKQDRVLTTVLGSTPYICGWNTGIAGRLAASLAGRS